MIDSADRVTGKLKDFLLQKKTPLLRRWFDLILETYPPDTRKFLESQKNPFANPVGATILKAIGGLYDEWLEGMDPGKISSFLDPIVRIRAVQDFSPSQAVAFIPLLKQAVKDELSRAIAENQLYEEWWEWGLRIDRLTLQAFDKYTECRTKIYEIRVNEWKNRSAKILELINFTGEKKEPGPDRQGSIDQPK